MSLKFFIIPINNIQEAEGELNAFLRAHRVLKMDRNWVDQGESSFWAICVDYLENSHHQATSGTREGIRGKIDYRQVLSPEEFARFAQLRDLRKAIAQTDAVPVYTIFTNEQLAKMIQTGSRTKADLEQIAGVGDARVVKYADRFLSLLNQQEGATTNAPDGRPV